MSSREFILNQISQNKPSLSPLPKVPLFERTDVQLLAHFIQTLEFVGGKAIELNENESIETKIVEIYPNVTQICPIITNATATPQTTRFMKG